jgi:hypothetical protein
LSSYVIGIAASGDDVIAHSDCNANPIDAGIVLAEAARERQLSGLKKG